METTQSELKIREEFNDCPGGDAIKDYFYTYRLNDAFDFVDLERFGWTNDPATMVIGSKHPIDSRIMASALAAIGKFATERNADEFDWKVNNGQMVIRLWWD